MRTHRSLVAAGLAAVLSGCGAGQVAQTAEQLGNAGGAADEIGQIALRDVTLDYPEGGVYEAGDDARLQFVVVNRDALESDTLMSVTSEAFSQVEAEEVEIPGNGSVSFREDGPVIELQGLAEDLRTTVSVAITFSFERAGEVTVAVPVATPLEVVERDVEDFDFHGGEEG
ncbi:lipoprotein [soil metagenome]